PRRAAGSSLTGAPRGVAGGVGGGGCRGAWRKSSPGAARLAPGRVRAARVSTSRRAEALELAVLDSMHRVVVEPEVVAELVHDGLADDLLHLLFVRRV